MAQINFNINYYTQWGEEICIIGNCPELGNGDLKNALPLSYSQNGNWNLSLNIEQDLELNYTYLLIKNKNIILKEWATTHRIQIKKGEIYKLFDHWQDTPSEKPFYSSAFTDNLFSRKDEDITNPAVFDKNLTIKIFAPSIRPNQLLAISGNCNELGNWDTNKSIPLDSTLFPEWKINLNASNLPQQIEFKFLILNKKNKEIICWENGDNRIINYSYSNEKESTIISGLHFENPLPRWKGAGVSIPVFSLKTKESFGIGEFNDLKKMVDWAVATGQRIIQILPINDTTMNHTWEDSYPYNANSIFALHPIYLNLSKIGILKDEKKMSYFTKRAEELNSLEQIDYEAVDHEKWKYFQEIYQQNKKETLSSNEFNHFFDKNKYWLIPYAAFSYFRDIYKTPDINQWRTNSIFNINEIKKLCDLTSNQYDNIALYFFLQFHLDKQLKEVVEYAKINNIILKGDIPIGISRNSVEAWVEPHLFNMNGQAGAPPDGFSIKGQNWGFPTYNWDAMKNDEYRWWKLRFSKMADYFDAYRIDHILGFFRIWEIPTNAVQGLLGYFTPSLPFSKEEIESYGFNFKENRLTKPFIKLTTLHEIFAEYTQEVIQTFLFQITEHEYELKYNFNNQQKIKDLFHDKSDQKSIFIRDGLYTLISEVLFIVDPYQTNKYHPRISAQRTHSYKALSWEEKQKFNQLYNDFFYHRHNDFWYRQALQKLPVIMSATSMLVCAEDLGMIPQCVPAVLNELKILSLEIQRMPKAENKDFDNPENYPYLSVATTSTHDMSTIRGWWKEDRHQTLNYYHQFLQKTGHAPEECLSTICQEIIFKHLLSPAMMVILPFQDWLSMDSEIRFNDAGAERINIPSNPRHYWRYRMHIKLEDLLEQYQFNEKIKTMISQSDR